MNGEEIKNKKERASGLVKLGSSFEEHSHAAHNQTLIKLTTPYTTKEWPQQFEHHQNLENIGHKFENHQN